MECMVCGGECDTLVCKKCLEKSQYQAKAHLVLEGSEQFEWGVVKDCGRSVNYIPEDAEVVGTWSRYGGGTFWVSLETHLQALQDKAVLLISELAARRQEELKRFGAPKPTRRVSKPKEPAAPSVFDELRTSLNQ